MKRALRHCWLLPLLLAALRAHAAVSPVGYWTTVDDNTHEARAIVAIVEQDGVLSGRVVKLFRKPGEDPDPHCEKCSGSRHQARVIGMEILWGLRQRGDEWSGGEILDPETGGVYRATIRTVDGGARLDVRGFIGISLLGRSQVWQRSDAP
jgi:uncharacterized protein (DUF2147 family)